MSVPTTFRILLSPTAFKGTLSPHQATNLLARVIKTVAPRWTVWRCPVADGGDGTWEVLAAVSKSRRMQTRVKGPLGPSVMASWSILNRSPMGREKTALIEMARASGLALVKGRNRVMEATTYGTGELIRAALDRTCRSIVIGVGGTATSDGGAGALRALGLKYFDSKDNELNGAPCEMMRLHRIDWRGLDPRLRKTKIYVVCDVTNPLLGPSGSARVFGPQKGARPHEVKQLECVLRLWSKFATHKTQNQPGAGAAGALAYGLSGFLGARLVQGSPFVFQWVHWTALARRAHAIIAGEGQLDATSFSGKTIGHMLQYKPKARLYVICGRNRIPASALAKKGIAGVVELGPRGLKYPQKQFLKAARTLLAKILRKL